MDGEPQNDRDERGEKNARFRLGRGRRSDTARDESDVAESAPEDRRKRRQMPLWQELPLLLVIAFCLAVLIRTFLVQAFFIPSGSMEDTLLVGDRVLVNKVVYDLRQPERGEVVVFRGTANWAPEIPPQEEPGFFRKLARSMGDLVGISQPTEKDFIKRVIGLPGDTVACCDAGRVTVNGYPLDESAYVIRNSPDDAPPSPRECRSRQFGPITVEPGQMFVMGDHRLVSQDSRCQGQVPIDNVIGRAFAIVWPDDRWSTLPVPPTFEKIPKPFAAGRLGPVGDVSEGAGRPAVGDGARGPTTSTSAPSTDDADLPASAPDYAVVVHRAAPQPLPGALAAVAPLLAAALIPRRSRLARKRRHRRLRE